jgi:hypothetical protein
MSCSTSIKATALKHGNVFSYPSGKQRWRCISLNKSRSHWTIQNLRTNTYGNVTRFFPTSFDGYLTLFN